MISRSWQLAEVDEALADRLARQVGVRPLVARLLVSRGLADPAAAARFLEPRLQHLRPPEGMQDLERALERLARALREGHRIGVFGDYDVDGVTSAAVLASALGLMGAAVVPRVASRHMGYGLPAMMIDAFASQGCRLIVTGDCGTSDVEALARAVELGIDVIVIDHHQIPSGEKLAYAVINPLQGGDHFPFKGLASCGIAFYLMAALRSRLGQSSLDMRQFLDLVALGTIADLVPLVDENRILVSVGLKVIAARQRPGLRALMELAHVAEGPMGTEDVSFRLAPRLNAAGRLGDAQVALDLLLARTDGEATRLAAELEELNCERQRIQEQVWTEALAEIAAAADGVGFGTASAIVIGAQGWHPGVVGIIAARLVDRFNKPVVVVGFDGALGRGSARTVPGVNLYEALAACREHLVRFGGHAAAAGMTLAPGCLVDFRRAFAAHVEANQGAGSLSVVIVDGILDLAEINLGLAEELGRLAPFGVSNREPILVLPGVTATETRVVGRGHLQLTLTGGGAHGEAIAFHMAEQDPGRGARVDLIGVADLDIYRGVRRARLRVKHLVRPVGPPS
jgi:single-stranded-DNA-specific exonuclease